MNSLSLSDLPDKHIKGQGGRYKAISKMNGFIKGNVFFLPLSKKKLKYCSSLLAVPVVSAIDFLEK